MSWKPVIATVGVISYLIIFIASGAYLLVDNTCGIDKASLEKRCQKALDHYRGKQVNL